MKLMDIGSPRARIGTVACTMLLAAQLAGCSGSSSGSPAPPPISNNPPAPEMVSLRLEGKVTDQPIPSAEVTVSIGEETFTTTADANGDYAIDIEIEETDANEFVVLNARGVGDQTFVEFTSLAGSFQSLIEQAGDDETLTSSENFSTQITNVSTAEAVFILEANGGEPVTSNAVLQTMRAQINAQDVLNLAAAIKLAVDDPQNYPLPTGQTSILALASSASARQQFVDQTYDQDPAAFSAIQAAIVQDAGLAQPIDIETDLSFTSIMLSTDPDFSFNYSGRVLHFDIYDDGTGFAISDSYDMPMTWAVEGSTIRVIYQTPIETVSYDTENCVGNGGLRQVEAHYVSEGATIAFLSASTVAITTTSDVTYADCASLDPRIDISTSARTILTLDSFDAIDVEELYGEATTIYVYHALQDAIVADIADLEADGTGTTQLTNQTFTWSIDETGKIISAEFADGTRAEYLSLRDIDALSSDLFYEIRTPNDGPVYMGAAASVFADPEYDVEFTAADVPGRFYQFGVGNEQYDDERLGGFRLRFDASFTGAQEDDYIDEQTGELVTIDETDYAYNAFRWSIDGEDIVVRRTYDNVQDNCLFGDAGCILYDERRIIPIAMNGSRIYWIEQRRFQSGGITGDTPATHLVRFYDFEPFAAAARGSMKPQRAVSASNTRQLLRGAQQR